MKLLTLYDCFCAKTMALYDIETQLVKALPKMAKNATNPKLKEALSNHLMETEEHVRRLESIFELLEIKPKKLKVEAIRGLIADDSWSMEQDTTPATLDSLLIAGARYVEHFEMAGYMSLFEWAGILDLGEAQAHIEETLEEEKNADELLKQIAEEVNQEAAENLETEDDAESEDDAETEEDEEEGSEEEEEA